MSKTTVTILLCVVRVLGLALGYGVTRLFGPGPAGKVRNAKLRVGDVAPDFRLPDHTGGYVRLSDYRWQSHVVIGFYPLAWTPV